MSRNPGVPTSRTRRLLVASTSLVVFAVAAALAAATALPAVALASTDGGGVAAPALAPRAQEVGPGLHISMAVPVPFSDDMESGAGNWTATGTWALTEEWDWPVAHSATHSWSDSPGGDYANNADSSITSRVIDLSEVSPTGTILAFNYSLHLEDQRDYLWVQCSPDGGSTWSDMVATAGLATAGAGSALADVDYLSGHVDQGYFGVFIPPSLCTSQFRVRLRLVSDGANTDDGVHIDDVRILNQATQYPEQDHAYVTYVGDWVNAADSFASGRSLYYADSPGAVALVNFTGTGLQLEAMTGRTYGIADVSLDGAPPVAVDFYDEGRIVGAKPYDTGNLTDGPHTLTISWTGTKNPASSGYGVDIDAFHVWGALTPAPVPTRYQQNDPSFNYVGSWSPAWTWSASGGSLTSADSPGSAVNVTFDGTYCAWIAKKGPGYGRAQVSLDGGAPVSVDLYSPYDRYKQRVYNTGLLADGAHTLSIYWTGQKNPAAGGARIDVDTFDLFGTPTPAPAPEPMLWRYQQTDPRLTYLGAWSRASTWSASGGSLDYTSTANAAVLVDFTGTSVGLLAKTAPWCGRAAVSLDGAAPEYVDFYSPAQLYKQTVWSATGLSPGAHTLSIKCLGDKIPPSSGYSISLDALDITGYLTQAPMSTRYQQDNGNFGYTGSWATGWTWSASGGSYAYAGSFGAEVTVIFNGTYLGWIANTGPQYGKAQVTLDGGAPVLVDLYSSYSKYKQVVYSTGPLEDGAHSLTIRWSGLRNYAASGYLVDIDALDVMGTLGDASTGLASVNYLARTQDQFHDSFDVYTDADAAGNHFAARGAMGGLSETELPAMDEAWTSSARSGLTCIKAGFAGSWGDWGGWYLMNGVLGAGDSGPQLNWGDHPNAGVDLTGAKTLTFWARGAVGGERVEFFALGVGRSAFTGNPTYPYPDSSKKIGTGFVTLTRAWKQYVLYLSGRDLSYVLGGFGWVTNGGENAGRAITFYLDDISYDKARLTEPRFLVSYKTTASGLPVDKVLRNAAFTYDNAVALLAFLDAGRIDRAKLIADALVYAQNHDRYYTDGRVRNAYQGGDLVLPPGWTPHGKVGTVRMPGWYEESTGQWLEDPTQVSTYTGNVAWAMLALLAYYERVGGEEYLAAAEEMGEWVQGECYDALDPGDPLDLGGYTAGYEGWEPSPDKLTYKSTEHNLDLYAAFSQLYRLTANGDWQTRADHAKAFVIAMWDAADGKFWTGTGDDGRKVNKTVIPVDIQAWARLALGSEGATYRAALTYAELHHQVDDRGFDFDEDRDGVWYEGTAQMAEAYAFDGQHDKWQHWVEALDAARDASGGIWAASKDGLTTGFYLKDGTPWLYYHRLHVGATAWLVLAQRRVNPFWQGIPAP